MTKTLSLAVVFMLAHLGGVAKGEEIPEISSLVREQVSASVAALDRAGRVDAMTLPKSWDLTQIHVRVQGIFGIKVPVLASFEVVPEVELVWKYTAK